MDKSEIIKLIDKLPRFSTTVTKIMQLSSDPRSSPKDIINAISMDPSLTAQVLKMINSAYFGVPYKVVSLNRAVVMLGLNTIKNVAIGSSVATNMKMRDDFKWFTGEEFWEHNLGVAVGAKMIAEKVGIPSTEREEFFIAGLLHDIGKMVFVQHVTREFAEVIDPEKTSGEIVHELETNAFGINHAELGSVMAEKWQLPQLLSETISQHHDPIFGESEFDSVKAAVHLANVFCNKMQIGIKSKVGMRKEKPEALEFLRLTVDDLEMVFNGLEGNVEKAKVFLKN